MLMIPELQPAAQNALPTAPMASLTDSPPSNPDAHDALKKKLEKTGARFGLESDMFRSFQMIIDRGRARNPDAPQGAYTSW